ncbi:unnamed protein product [Aphanomyces euteiches]|uniref:PDZ domain-containing protein n=1 Tax=Aphanomyces euteiches TaxID=100861 RepID=A0A6G0WAL0_9STRA|nr:hypothetical protein Ae201684_016958 [Aphanomyces euteiches]KAH9073737.1 hypothetical protein Ae201684P_003240 [Aphanomyces euteiches]KAH9134270.1 hypothetical protein AeRB84_019900 [Aphanomyces euteiches]
MEKDGSSQDGNNNAQEELSVFFNVAGLYQKIVVQEGWFVGDLIKFMAKISSNLHPHAEVPECNAIRNNQTRKFVALADPATRVLVQGNLYDLLFVDKASKTTTAPTLDLDEEIHVVFYNNPLGITMKPAGDGTYVVATKKKELNCYRRLTPGMQVVSVGGAKLTGMDFREFHTTMANSVFPLTIVFRATRESIEYLKNTPATTETLPEQTPTKPSLPPLPSTTSSSSENQVPNDTFSLPVPVVFHDDGTIESKVRRLDLKADDNSDPLSRPSATLEDEARLEQGLKSLNEAFYKKKRELNEIVERIREYTQQLTAVRVALGKYDGVDPFRSTNGSVISGTSTSSSVVQKRLPPSSTPSKLKLSSTASVSSLTSTCSIDRMAFKKSKLMGNKQRSEVSATSGRLTSKKPLNTTAFSSTLNLPSSFSTKGAVIPQAQTPRFLAPKSITPGVGHYDVKDLTKNVKGGEIGDSGRDLQWG